MEHEKFMKRCIELARLGHGPAAPNPMVGCVVVKDGIIIGEGYHRKFGGPHAEVNAIASVKDESLLLESTLYVSLEPCCHHGKTPPCADLIIAKGIPRVVVGTRDPYPKVRGGGIQKLRDAGVEVIEDILKDEAKELNQRFFTAHQKNRPYIILKWAQSADGFMAPRDQKSGSITWISGQTSRVLTHKWRSEEQAILVGSNTVRKDDPSLTTREYPGESPTRVVIDPELETSMGIKSSVDLAAKRKVFSDDAATLVYNFHKDEEMDHIHFIKADENGFLPYVLKDLVHRKIYSLIVEGGPATLRGFIQSNLWDEARIFIGKRVLHEGIMAPVMDGELRRVSSIDQDLLQFYINHRS